MNGLSGLQHLQLLMSPLASTPYFYSLPNFDISLQVQPPPVTHVE